MPAGLVIAAIGLGISIYQGAKASKDRKEAQNAIESYDRQDLVNPYLSLDKYPTQAIQLQKEANERELAANVSIASRAGRGLTLMPQASSVYNRRSRELSAEVEQYQYERQKLIIQGEQQVIGMKEQREMQDIAGLGQLNAVAAQNQNNAMVSAGNSLAMGAQMYSENPNSFTFGGNKSNPQTSPKFGEFGYSPYSSNLTTVPQISTNYDSVPLNPYAQQSGLDFGTLYNTQPYN